jgi:hypothetical protein
VANSVSAMAGGKSLSVASNDGERHSSPFCRRCARARLPTGMVRSGPGNHMPPHACRRLAGSPSARPLGGLPTDPGDPFGLAPILSTSPRRSRGPCETTGCLGWRWGRGRSALLVDAAQDPAVLRIDEMHSPAPEAAHGFIGHTGSSDDPSSATQPCTR